MYEFIGIPARSQDGAAWADLAHSDGRILKWLGTNTDIDQQKRSEHALQDANRRKDMFLAVLSHELRNPLAPIVAANAAAGTGAQPGMRRVLVVDDNADAAQTVAMLLQVLGHETAVEYDPLRALACVRERAFDAFILDIGLPGMDGHELARQIRALPGAAGALFIALTGYGQQQDRDASSAAGFHYHFVKPANVDALLQALTGGVPG